MRSLTSLLMLALMAAQPAVADGTTVEGVRLWAGPDHTRVVLDLDSPVDHTLFTLSDPERVVIDIRDTRLAASVPEGDGLISRLRTGNDGDVLRVVLDLSRSAQPRSFLTPPNATYGHRLVIDLSPKAGGEVAQARPVKQAPAPKREGGRDLIVAVDAGHGGEDPGAIGRSGLYEKDAVLAIARRLADAIDAEPGMRAVLTRDGDYFIPLRDRREKARAAKADLFVSVHADSFRDPRARGAHVYVLSDRGASSEMARMLAERENASDLIGGVSLKDKDDVLASVLLDLSQQAAISASLDLGEKVLGGIGRVNHLHKETVQQAGFAVLKSPDMPSILIETAYISNPDEERKLKDPGYQARMATAVLDGIRDYFYEAAPPGTLIASLRRSREAVQQYVVASGDTLSTIARRHRVDVDDIRRANNLRGDTIRAGQVIMVPRGP